MTKPRRYKRFSSEFKREAIRWRLSLLRVDFVDGRCIPKAAIGQVIANSTARVVADVGYWWTKGRLPAGADGRK